jgi:hypothetical protein
VEELATFVAYLFIALGVISILNILFAVLARKSKVRLWVGHISNTVTGLIAIWCISVAWALALFPILSVASASIVLTFPRRAK